MASLSECNGQLFYATTLLVMVMISSVAVAQSPPPSSGCANSLLSLSPCLSYINSNATTSAPPQSCCGALSSVVKTSAVCLCQLFTGNNPLGFPINQTRALQLPGACNISTPPLSRCNVAGGPAPSPSPSTGGSRDAPAPSPAAKSVPPPEPSTSTPIPPSASAVPPSSDKQPSGVPPTSSEGGQSPPGAGSSNPTASGGSHFKASKIISILGVVAMVTIVW